VVLPDPVPEGVLLLFTEPLVCVDVELLLLGFAGVISVLELLAEVTFPDNCDPEELLAETVALGDCDGLLLEFTEPVVELLADALLETDPDEELEVPELAVLDVVVCVEELDDGELAVA
jgi:hypothetical protein